MKTPNNTLTIKTLISSILIIYCSGCTEKENLEGQATLFSQAANIYAPYYTNRKNMVMRTVAGCIAGTYT